MKNAGKYNRKIVIYQIVEGIDKDGFPNQTEFEILTTFSSVKTLRGYTLITNNSDFEKAYTNFTIRYSEKVVKAYYDSLNSNRDLLIKFRDKTYTIEYFNNVDEANVELELQAKEVLK